MSETTTAPITQLSLAALPALGAPLDTGIFEGLTTRPDGTHCAVVRLPGYGANLTHKQAIVWAEEQGGELPSKAVAALITSNSKLKSGWYWTKELFNASYAWLFHSDGYTYDSIRSAEGGALAVRLIPLTD